MVPALTTATAVSTAAMPYTSARHTFTSRPTLRARRSPAASTLSGRASSSAPPRAVAATPSPSAGCVSQDRSPASQNTMLRTRLSSALVSTSVTRAPQTLATATPVSSTRVAPACRARAQTSTRVSSAPAAAAPCTARAVRPAAMAQMAPKAAPPDTPRT